MNDKKNEWERRLLKVLLPIIENEKEITLEELMDKGYPGEEKQLLEDLRELESYGMVKISREGGYFVRKGAGDYALAIRKRQRPSEKRLIGTFVGHDLRRYPDVTLAIDGGTTNLEVIKALLADELDGKATFRVLITNNLEALSLAADVLAEAGIDRANWLVTSGYLRTTRKTFAGIFAEESMEKFFPAISIIGINGLVLPDSLQTTGVMEVSFKRKMIERAGRMIIFPLDSSKWGMSAGIEMCCLDEIVRLEKEVILVTCYPKRELREKEDAYKNRTEQFLYEFGQLVFRWKQLYPSMEIESQIVTMKEEDELPTTHDVINIETSLREKAETLQSEGKHDAGLAISVHIKPFRFGAAFEVPLEQQSLRASRYFRALERAREEGNQREEIIILCNLGFLFMKLSNSKAREYFNNAIMIANQIGDRELLKFLERAKLFFELRLQPETIDEFICSVNHVEGDVAYLRLRGEKDGELRDFGLEYPLHELTAQIGKVSAGMMLKCQIQDNLQNVVLHFEQFTPQKLPLERRKAIQEEYNKMFKDFDEEEPLEIAETT